MQIQTFFLAKEIIQTGNLYDVRSAPIANFDCTPEARFPMRFPLPALMLLRRESDSGDVPFRLRFDLVDEDGRPAGLPRGMQDEKVFFAGARFYSLMAMIEFEFPAPGSYRLDITTEDEMGESLYSYAIDIRPRETA